MHLQSYLEYLQLECPEGDHMSVSRYVTDYRNAVSYIEAQKLEVEAQRLRLDMDKLLFDAGELSALAFSEQKLALAKAEYELELYYVDMNLSWAELMRFIR